ncbi:MAG: hypothetical protein ACLTDY_08690 [Dialister invisus]|jgi:hypothetical protein|uniref:hypothetical protein n=1 Tax=Dialister invisus TaxID=218538 RepID=UPI0032C07707
MILSSALLVIETILFLVSGRLHGYESLSQRFSYYIGGWVGLIYFSYLFMASFMGYDINIIITLIVMAIVFFFALNRTKYNFRIKYENAKEHCGKNSKNAKRFRSLVSYALYGQIIIFIGFIMILMVILLGSYNGRISLY